ncbi:MAG TPA: retention module-containing protein, partial [Verrucomicrobiae bacterium]|nr:retention module-containing protein [Verrucomicrobiae bacterium]
MADVKQVASGATLESIGTVKTVVGTVKAVDQSGAERILQAGDKVYANETIVTADGGLVLIEFADGSHLDLASASQMILDSDVFNPANAAPKGEELTAEQIQEMIARGEDPTAVTEATAAGAGAGDEGGSSFIVVDFNNTQGDVNSGFNTLGIPGPESTTFTELPPVEDEAVPTTTIVGSLLEIELDVEAQGIPEGSDVVYTVTLDKVSAGDITITLSNGAVIIIPAGQLSGSSDPIPVQGDDPYVDPSEEAVHIVSMTGGGANEVLEFDPAPVEFEVIDTINTTTVTLGDVTVDEGAGTATLSATVSNAVTGTPLVITLDNGATITIA